MTGGLDPWNEEWQRDQDTLAGQMEVLRVRFHLIGEAMIRDTPRPLRWVVAPLVRWAGRRLG